MDTPERIAKLEAQVESIKDDVTELKSDVKELHSRITTGNREIMDKIESMEKSLDTKMRANALQATDQHIQIENKVKSDLEELSGKITAIEKLKWILVGGAVVLGYFLAQLKLENLF